MSGVYLIFGKNIQINCAAGRSGDLLIEELSIYPKGNINSVDLTINYLDDLAVPKTGSQNPSIHQAMEDGFVMRQMNCHAAFRFAHGQLVTIDFAIPAKKKRRLNRVLNRWMSMQFTSNEEAIGQILHEQILVPSVFFDAKMTMIHASGAVLKNGHTILLGGTGGIGKTSLEMALCLEHDAAFATDDIAIVDRRGALWPNLSYPKIYGYNLEGNKPLKRKLLKGTSISRKLHWRLQSLRGQNFIRQRVSPKILYQQVQFDSTALNHYYILKREYREDVLLEKIATDEAAKMSRAIISAEYDGFLRHVLWQEFNQLHGSKSSIPGYKQIMGRIESNASEALKNVACHLIKIPVGMEHGEFKKQMTQLISNTEL